MEISNGGNEWSEAEQVLRLEPLSLNPIDRESLSEAARILAKARVAAELERIDEQERKNAELQFSSVFQTFGIRHWVVTSTAVALVVEAFRQFHLAGAIAMLMLSALGILIYFVADRERLNADEIRAQRQAVQRKFRQRRSIFNERIGSS